MHQNKHVLDKEKPWAISLRGDEYNISEKKSKDFNIAWRTWDGRSVKCNVRGHQRLSMDRTSPVKKPSLM